MPQKWHLYLKKIVKDAIGVLVGRLLVHPLDFFSKVTPFLHSIDLSIMSHLITRPCSE
jgi:hypothetical protein